MQRIEPAQEPYAPAIAESLARIMPPGVSPLLLFRTMARSQRVFSKLFAGGLLDRGPLTLREREIVIARTTARLGCEYEWGVHTALFAERVGFGAAELEAIVHGRAEASCWSEVERALIGLADDLIDHRTISQQTWRVVRPHLTDEQILEAIALVGYYHTISFLCNGLSLALEPFAARFPPAP